MSSRSGWTPPHERRRTHDGHLRSPGQAIRCARWLYARGANQDLHGGAGIHTGEVYLVGNEVFGDSVEIAASVAAHAKPGEVLVSRTVQDLVVGSGISFEERGSYNLKAVDGQWPLFAVIAE